MKISTFTVPGGFKNGEKEMIQENLITFFCNGIYLFTFLFKNDKKGIHCELPIGKYESHFAEWGDMEGV